MTLPRLFLAFAAALLVTAAPVRAQGTGLVGLDDRNDLFGWEAVGRLDFATGGFCTATLISPHLVLTAAHCVFDRSRNPTDPATLTFRAGFAHGAAVAERQVTRIAVPEAYVPTAPGQRTSQNARFDVALLELDTPISFTQADPFVLHDGPSDGAQVSTISYGKGREDHLSRQRHCNELWRHQGMIAFDCDVTFGSSGSPVFVKIGGRVRIVSVISKMAQAADGQKIALGMELPSLVADLKRQLRSGRRSPPAQVRRITVGGPRGGNGAKFIKP